MSIADASSPANAGNAIDRGPANVRMTGVGRYPLHYREVPDDEANHAGKPSDLTDRLTLRMPLGSECSQQARKVVTQF